MPARLVADSRTQGSTVKVNHASGPPTLCRLGTASLSCLSTLLHRSGRRRHCQDCWRVQRTGSCSSSARGTYHLAPRVLLLCSARRVSAARFRKRFSTLLRTSSGTQEGAVCSGEAQVPRKYGQPTCGPRGAYIPCPTHGVRKRHWSHGGGHTGTTVLFVSQRPAWPRSFEAQ